MFKYFWRICIISLFFNAFSLSAQNEILIGTIDTVTVSKYNRWSVYLGGGFTQFYGDVVRPYNYSPIFKYNDNYSLNGVIGLSRQLTQLFSIDGTFQKGSIYTERPYSNINSEIDLFYYNIGTKFSFSNWFWPNVKNRKWNSYLYMNTGFTHYRSAQFNSINNEIIDFYGFEMKNSHLEKTKRAIVPTAAIGFGVKYRLAKRWDIGAEIMLSSVYNDELDAYVRVFSEYDKFGHTNIGISYRFEKHKKSLLWDYSTQPYVISPLLLDQLCECPVVKENTVILDSLIQTIEYNTQKSDSLFAVISKKTDNVFDYFEKERAVALKSVDTNFGSDSISAHQTFNPLMYQTMVTFFDSIVQTIVVNNNRTDSIFQVVNSRTDSVYVVLERERIVNMYGIDSNFGIDSLPTPQYRLPFDYDSLLRSVARMNAIIDTLINEREQVLYALKQNGQQNTFNQNQDFIINREQPRNDVSTVRPNFVTYQGVVQDENNNPIKASIFVVDKETQDLVASFETNSATGKYTFSLPVGRDYSFLVSAEGYGFFSENITLNKEDIQPKERQVSMIKLEVGKKFVLRNIYYDFDKYSLRKESNTELNNLYNILIANPKMVIEISSHTDIIGSAAYNKTLSLNRAKVVVDYLVSRGISKNRLKYAGYGFDQPIAPNDTPEGRQLNRRTEFKILSN
jgi:outer membrane protein OmpA-like peptidoglycan-associated protein